MSSQTTAAAATMSERTGGSDSVTPRKRSAISKGAASLMAPGTTTPIPPFLALASLRIALTAFFLGLVAGLVLPRSLALFTESAWKQSENLTSWIIWKVWQKDAVLATEQPWHKVQLHFYLLAWSTFHLLEFVITARWNNTRLYSDSFLIQNGISYHLAHLFGITEFLIEAYIWPEWKRLSLWTCLGISMLCVGQVVRSLAMIHAAGNFSHEVAAYKRSDHELVTDGIYSTTRHPSYFGFFYWALGTQVALGNPVSTLVFAYVLWSFFSRRIRGEETYLVSFFGEQYVEYRKRTRTYIPFIR